MAASSRFSISATISMIDKVSPNMGKAARSITGFSKKMRGQFNRADISANRINKSINRIGGRAAKIGLGGLAVGAGLVARQFVQFDDAIFGATAKFGDLNFATVEGQKKMEALRATARKVGADTKFNAVQAAQGLEFLAMASFNTDQAIASLPGVVNLATVANVDLARATDIASDSLGAFNLMSKDSTQLQTNLTRVNDVAAKTTTMFNTTLEGLFDAVSKGAAQFTNSGQSIESFSTLVGVMAQASVKGSESGTQLRNIMLRLSAPTSRASAMMKKMGIIVQDSQGNFRDIIDILDDVKKGTKGMGDVQRSAALNTIFGARAITGVNILLNQGTKSLLTYRDALIKSGGSAKKMAAIIEQSMGNRLRALSSALTEFGFKIIEAFAGKGKKGIQVLTEGIRNIDPQPLVNLLKTIGSFIQITLPIIPWMLGFVVAIKGIVFITKAWTAIQWLLNVAMTANPIGLIVVAVAALVAGVVLLISKWEKMKALFSSTTIPKAQIEARQKAVSSANELFPGTPGGATPNQFASPQSQGITNTNNNNTTGSLDVNFNNAPAGTSVKQKGQMPPGTTLNTGLETP